MYVAVGLVRPEYKVWENYIILLESVLVKTFALFHNAAWFVSRSDFDFLCLFAVNLKLLYCQNVH